MPNLFSKVSRYDFTDNLVLSLIDLTEGSPYENPVIAAHLEEEGHIAAGYLVIHPGALGSRRPNSQGDPYKIAGRILQTINTVPKAGAKPAAKAKK